MSRPPAVSERAELEAEAQNARFDSDAPDQARVPGTARRAVPAGPIRRGSTAPPLESSRAPRNLFNADRWDEAARLEASQANLFAGGAD